MKKDEEFTYKHFVIQFAETLIEKYFLHPRTSHQFPAESSVYAVLFGETIGITNSQLQNILSNVGETRNELIKIILTDMKTQFKTNAGLKMNVSLRDQLAEYLESTYKDRLNDSRIRTLTGDLFVVSLVEIVYSREIGVERILRNQLLAELKEKKSDSFLSKLIELMDGNSSGTQIILEGPNNSDYVKMAAGLGQYFRYNGILNQITNKSKEIQEINYHDLLKEHLMFLKYLSTDVYSFLDEDVPSFPPTDSVFVKYFCLASLLIKTDYTNSIILNSPFSAKFINEEFKDTTPVQKLINLEADKKIIEIMDSNDDATLILNRFFNPFRFLRKYIGIFGSWILWDILVLIPLILGLYNLIDYTKYSVIIPYTTIPVPGIIIPSIILIYLLISLLILLYKSWSITKKTRR